MTPIRRYTPESTDSRPCDLYQCGSRGMFLVSLLYERKCLRIDLIKINCCLNVPFIIWSLYVLNSVTSELQCGSCRVFIALAERKSYLLQCAFSWHLKQNGLPNSMLGVLVTGQAQFEGISKLIQANRVIIKVCLQIFFVRGSETCLQAWIRKNTRG